MNPFLQQEQNDLPFRLYVENTTSAITVWDGTIKAWTLSWSKQKDLLIDLFKKIAEKWVFQLEKGDKTDYMHFQCRIKLKTRVRGQRLYSILKQSQIGSELSDSRWTPTCTATTKKTGVMAFEYVMKEETRFAGPWADKEDVLDRLKEDREKEQEKKDEEDYVRSIVGVSDELKELKLRPWQKQIVEIIKKFNDSGKRDNRACVVVYDPVGRSGKTTLREYLHAHKMARVMPHFKTVEDMMQYGMAKPHLVYAIDIPRGVKHGGADSFWAGIETMLDGRFYDKRYEYRELTLKRRPLLIMFTNTLPDMGHLTQDRVVLKTIGFKDDLVNYDQAKDAARVAFRSLKRNIEDEQERKANPEPTEEPDAEYFAKPVAFATIEEYWKKTYIEPELGIGRHKRKRDPLDLIDVI